METVLSLHVLVEPKHPPARSERALMSPGAMTSRSVRIGP